MIGTVPLTQTFSLQDVANVVGYNNLVDCEANSAGGAFPGGNANIGSLLHFRGYFKSQGSWATSNTTQSVTISPYIGNRILILQIASTGTQLRTTGSPTLNGASFTQAGNNNGINSIEIWYIVNPPSGTFNFYIQTTTEVYFRLNIIPYVGSISLHSSGFQSGSSISPSITLAVPISESIAIINSRCVPKSAVISSNFLGWQKIGWQSGNYSSGDMYCYVGSYSNPATLQHTLEAAASWQIAAAVFNIS